MNDVMEGRPSDSPFVHRVWRGVTGKNYTPTCPADEQWDLLLQWHDDRVRVLVEAPLTRAKYKELPEGVESLVIKFKLGVFMPYFPIRTFLDDDVVLPTGAGQSFCLNGATWQFPDYDNVEAFVARLVREDVLFHDPLVSAVLRDQPTDASPRTLRRRFVHATGLTYGTIRQINRARQAMTLLQQGVSILDAVELAGYADQPHLTRSLKHFIGFTPTQIAREVAFA